MGGSALPSLPGLELYPIPEIRGCVVMLCVPRMSNTTRCIMATLQVLFKCIVKWY